MALVVFSGGALVAEHTTCEVTRAYKEILLDFARILLFTIFNGLLI